MAGLLCAAVLGCSGAQETVAAGTPLERAIALREQGRLVDAERELMILSDRGDLAAQIALAETLLLRGRHAEAAALLQPRLDANPGDAEVAGLLARAYDGAGAMDLAIAAYARRLTLRPGDAAAAVRMAELLIQRKDFVNAGNVAEAGLKLNPDHSLLHVQSARALLKRGRVPQALAAAHQATRLGGQSSEAWLVLGEVLVVAGELDMAEVAFGKCLALDPQHPEALRELGVVLTEKGEAVKAIAILRRALAVAPESVQAWHAMALARHRAHDYDAALAALEQATRIRPGLPQLHVALAEVALDHGQPRRAVAEAARALVLLQNANADAKMRTPVADLAIRAAVVAGLADHLCRRLRDAKALQLDIDRDLAAHGLSVTPDDAARIGASATDHIKAAQARCSSKGPP